MHGLVQTRPRSLSPPAAWPGRHSTCQAEGRSTRRPRPGSGGPTCTSGAPTNRARPPRPESDGGAGVEFGEGTDYRSPPLRLAPGRVGDERQVGHVAPRFATHDCARTGIAATCFDPGLDRDGLPSLEGFLKSDNTLARWTACSLTHSGLCSCSARAMWTAEKRACRGGRVDALSARWNALSSFRGSPPPLSGTSPGRRPSQLILAGVARKKPWSQASSLWRGSVTGYELVRFLEQPKTDPNRLLLYGNVDLRQVELAFNNSGANR